MTTLNPGVDDAAGSYDRAVTSSRQRGMAEALARLRKRTGSDFPLTRVLLITGGMCLPIGVIVIVVGWYGSAHTLNLYEQNDYLISGGVLGLALVNIGGFLYFGYWMTRQLQTSKAALLQMQTSSSKMQDQLAEVVSAVASLTSAVVESGGSGSARPVGRTRAPAGRVAVRPARLVATERGTLAHRPSCSVVVGKGNLRPLEAGQPGFRPCQICNPEGFTP